MSDLILTMMSLTTTFVLTAVEFSPNASFSRTAHSSRPYSLPAGVCDPTANETAIRRKKGHALLGRIRLFVARVESRGNVGVAQASAARIRTEDQVTLADEEFSCGLRREDRIVQVRDRHLQAKHGESLGRRVSRQALAWEMPDEGRGSPD